MTASNIFLIIVIVTISSLANANVTRAKSVVGFDNVSKTSATDCTVVAEVSPIDSQQIMISINSHSAPYASTYLNIPISLLPLQEGQIITDSKKIRIHYSQNTLHMKWFRSGDGPGTEIRTVEIRVTPNLDQVYSIKLQSLSGIFFKTISSKLDCKF